MAWGSAFRRPVNYQTKASVAQAGYANLNNARQRKMDAEVQKAWREHEKKQSTASDAENLAAIGVQAAAAYFSGGTSLMFAPQINELTFHAMGKPKAARGSHAGQASQLAQIGHGVYSASKAEKVAEMDDAHEKEMNMMEKEYDALLASGDTVNARNLALKMRDNERTYSQHRVEAKKSWGDEMFGGSWGYDALSHRDLKQPEYEAQKVPIDAEIESTEKSLMNLGQNPGDLGVMQDGYDKWKAKQQTAYSKANSTREVQPNTPADQLVEPTLNEQLMAGAGNSGTTANEFSQQAQARFAQEQARNANKIQQQRNPEADLLDRSALNRGGTRLRRGLR